MRPIGSSETSVRNYHCTLRNIPEERRSHLRSFIMLWYWPRNPGRRTGNAACHSVKLYFTMAPAGWLCRGFSIIIYPWYILFVLKISIPSVLFFVVIVFKSAFPNFISLSKHSPCVRIFSLFKYVIRGRVDRGWGLHTESWLQKRGDEARVIRKWKGCWCRRVVYGGVSHGGCIGASFVKDERHTNRCYTLTE